MDEKYLWIGGGVLAVVILFMSRSGAGSAVINRADPNAAAEAQSRSDFASRGLESLSSVARADISGGTSRYIADVGGATSRYIADATTSAQVAIQQSRDAALTRSAQAAADAQITAAKAAARASSNNGFFNMVSNVAKGALALLAF